jgi:hypothetical protein
MERICDEQLLRSSVHGTRNVHGAICMRYLKQCMEQCAWNSAWNECAWISVHGASVYRSKVSRGVMSVHGTNQCRMEQCDALSSVMLMYGAVCIEQCAWVN